MSISRRVFLTAAGAVTAISAAPGIATATRHRFRDPRLPLERRIDDLLGRLTLDEKVSLLHQYQPPVPRLGIGRFKTGTEALHGLAWSTDIHSTPEPGAVRTATATVFPQAVGLGSTWDRELIREVGTAVGVEARGYHSANPDVWGLNLWAPVVNLLRDPRWGRNEEGYAEDPHLTGVISTAYARGMRGDHPHHLRTAPTLKHYLANNNEIRRDRTSSNLRPRVKHEYDELAFRPAIASDAATGVMAAYNLVNGRPMTAHADHDDVVRSWTDQTLMNVTDAGGPNNLIGSQAYYPTLTEGNAATLKAGLDSFTVDNTDAGPTTASVRAALAAGLLAESDVDRAVRRILSIRFRLGEFDPDGGPYAGITMDAVDSPAHRRLARRAAGAAAVLLKNDGVLPLPAHGRVAVVGPLADTLYTDWYSGGMPYRVTPRAGIAARLGEHGTVTGGEAVDRVALRSVDTGRYVTAGVGEGAPLAVTGASAGTTEWFDVFGWGQGVVTLRSAANGRYVERDGFGATSGFVNRAPQPRDWFVHQQFTFEDVGAAVVVKYVGYETVNDWEGPNNYLTVAADGTLVLGSPDAAGAARFVVETVSSGVDGAVAAASDADAAVVVVGSMPFINGREDHDRTTMALAESQSALVRAVHAANPNTVVVVENSYPTTLTWEQEHVPAILWTSHAGQETGNAIADVLFGDVNPAGRLTQTWYRSDDDLPSILDYDIIKARRTYLYFDGDPLYPFGHGLSYSTFDYGRPRVTEHVGPHGTVRVTVEVTNTSGVDGDEVVQVYTRQRESRNPQPRRRLRAFERVHVPAGRTRTVRLSFPARDLGHWDVTRGRWVVERATHDVLVGASSADVRRRESVRVHGETIPARDLSRPTRGVDFDDYAGVELVDTSKERGDAVGAGAGDWLRFADCDLDRAETFTARVARAEPGTAGIEVRLDDPAGQLAGTAVVESTGDVYAYATTTARVRGVRGRRDVYLVFTGQVRLDSFTLR
ncbi:glycoside hydrolase family 3 protein [Actinophytocola gossypii]|uniref:Glycoside hydrolase family 3 C-terminal domain-containing protein n=1 Tax=Actinophytocola gossypii TaxID=2812003 RepID=A0ABT2J1G8_9PSEU|nr:glycoside hydrolase family 3 protein [Actinophytocola gossypii]MCT2581611.1 glycoside hydrolase family 3 C-terminal domain-containing protein [Actinophytocola gossypii]